MPSSQPHRETGSTRPPSADPDAPRPGASIERTLPTGRGPWEWVRACVRSLRRGEPLSVRNRILVVLFAVALQLTLVGGLLASRSRELQEVERDWVQRTNAVLLALEQVRLGVSLAETGYRGYLLTRDTVYLARGRTAPAEARAAVRRARELSGDLPEQRDRLAALERVTEAKLRHAAEVTARARAADWDGALELVRTREGESFSREIMDLVGEAQTVERDVLTQRVLREAVASQALAQGLALAGLGALLTLLGTIIVSRQEASRTGRALAEADWERRRLAAVLDALPVGVVIADGAAQVVSLTGEARRLWSALSGGVVPTSVRDYARLEGWHRETGARLTAEEWPLVRTLATGAPSACEVEFRPPGVSPIVVLIGAAPIRDAHGRPAGAVAVWTDLTERIALEERLRHARKLEAVGQLAGGIAHDFNNLLTVITGNLEFVRQELRSGLPTAPSVHADLAEIGRASERARTLVRQLLAFSRRQPIRPRRVRLGTVVRGAEALLRRVIGEEITLVVEVASDEPVVHADPGQLEQVLVNLAVNARDAMLTPGYGLPGSGGTLEITVDRVELSPVDAAAWDEAGAGTYARLLVSDTGHGMDAATCTRAFEPFFTTKPVGAGTGLGLATVHGIVRQAGGAIRAESAPGLGATFTILLPAAVAAEEPDAEPSSLAASAPTFGPRAGNGTVLLVEDETPVRATIRRLLERNGYQVLEARHGGEALLVWRAHRAQIDVVVTDVRMPELGGRELVHRLRAEVPELAAVFMSGYSDEGAFVAQGPRETFLAKPFSAAAVLAAIGSVRAVPVG